MSASNSAALLVRNLSRSYGTIAALRDVSLQVREGEILGLIGPNGSGKTTLFECVAGVIPADSGSVALGDVDLGQPRRKAALFYLPDGIRPWPDQRVSWVLALIGDLYGVSVPDRLAIISALGLGAHLGARMRSLSKGEHKRVMLATALLATQQMLLLDEPFEGLDLRQTREMMDVLRAQRERGKTLFLSIHQLLDAERVCDRFVLLSAGRTVGEGTLHDLRGAVGRPTATLEEVFLALT
ncbi:MAG: ABC transporter ATP-binding protein [Gemmatimonadota bacterium]